MRNEPKVFSIVAWVVMIIFSILFTLFAFVVFESVKGLLLGILLIFFLCVAIVYWWKKIGAKL